VPRWDPSCHDGKPKSNRKTINRALLLHNYSFRNLENYFSIRSKGGGALGKELSPFNGKGNFLRKVARLLVCIYLILVI
jgi:hypothetical protein